MRFFQIQFHDKKNFISLNTFIRKNKRHYVYSPIPHNWPSISRDHQTVKIMNHFCYCLYGLWKVKGKYIQNAILYIVLCLNVLAKLQKARGAFFPPSFDGQLPDMQSYALALSIH